MQTRHLLVCLASSFLLAITCHAQVGQRHIQSGDLPIVLTYPTAAATQAVRQGPFTFDVAVNAAPVPAPTGKRRLIVLSHGTAGSYSSDHDLAATLARAGFVVAQPLHRGDNYLDFSRAGPESWQTRPQEVSETIHAVMQDAALGRQINPQRVGVHGMSAGGVTGLVLAGAQWRMLDLIRHCAAHMDEDIGFCLNGLAQQAKSQSLRKEQLLAARALTEDNAPEGLKVLHGGQSLTESVDPRPDPRVAAVSLLVPVAAIFTPESLARIRIPVGLTTAGQDEVLLPRWHSGHVLQHCSSCITLSHAPEAGHFDWLSPWPQDIANSVAATQIRGGFPNPSFTTAMRHKAFEQIALFFQQHL